jgi:hypothetical protein
MLNRVNIQYSINLDDLPEEVDRIYNKAKEILGGISLPNQSGRDLLTSETLKELDETRQKLTSLDHILSDVAAIVGSYVEYEISQINTPSQSEPDVQDTTEMST